MALKREHGLAALDPGLEVENDTDDQATEVGNDFSFENDPNCFATVISRFDPLHKKKKYMVSNQEIVRRFGSPERMNVTKIEEYVRESKRPSDHKVLKRRLSSLGLDLKRKRHMRTSAFTRWAEAESKEVVNSLEDDCTAYFPKNDVVGIIDKSLENLNEDSKKLVVEKTKEILSAISDSINSVENFDNPVWSRYAKISHEFGPWAIKYFVTLLIDSCESLLE